VLHEETLFLQRLISHLQDLALAEAGRLDLRSAPVDVGDALRRAAAALESAAGAPITLTVEPDVPAVLGTPAGSSRCFGICLGRGSRFTVFLPMAAR